MAGWRKALLQTGRENDLYHCQLCKHRLFVKQRRLWATLLHYKGKLPLPLLHRKMFLLHGRKNTDFSAL
jgi:DNA-directed RNA polymerase subunit RPC12/RpoP